MSKSENHLISLHTIMKNNKDLNLLTNTYFETIASYNTYTGKLDLEEDHDFWKLGEDMREDVLDLVSIPVDRIILPKMFDTVYNVFKKYEDDIEDSHVYFMLGCMGSWNKVFFN